MAVPKRKMSRSNTRSRRAQWKTTAAPLQPCKRCREPKLPTSPARPAAPTTTATSWTSERRDRATASSAQVRAGLEPTGTVSSARCSTSRVDVDLLERALTHRSFAYENGSLPTNERLEFLGDSVLGLVVTDTLYRSHPELPEGQLAKLRAAVVNMRALADVGRDLRLGEFVRLGRGEETTGGRDKSSILADTLEAVLGAVYIDQHLPAAADAGPPALRPADRGGRDARRRPRLEDLPAGAHGERRDGRPRVRRHRDRPGPPEALHRGRPGGRRRLRPGPGPQQEGSRAGGRRDGLAPAAQPRCPPTSCPPTT